MGIARRSGVAGLPDGGVIGARLDRSGIRERGRRAWAVAALTATLLILSGLAASSASAETVWLCKPGIASNPCTSSEETTVQLGNGSSFVEHPEPASNPPIDCFYVYPTVSSQLTENATLAINPEETQIAIDQASRFSRSCKVYAPIYPQLTLPAITRPGGVTAAAIRKGVSRGARGVAGIPRQVQRRQGRRADRPLAGRADAQAADQRTDRPQPGASQTARVRHPARRKRVGSEGPGRRRELRECSRLPSRPDRSDASSRTPRS